MFRVVVAAVLSSVAAAAAASDGCEALRAEIEGKIRDAGVQVFSVMTVDADANAPGEVVGSCGQGSRKIVYLKGVKAADAPAPAAAAADRPAPVRPAVDAVLTECKPGFVSIRGECKRI